MYIKNVLSAKGGFNPKPSPLGYASIYHPSIYHRLNSIALSLTHSASTLLAR